MAVASDETPQDRQIADVLIEDIVEWRIAPGSWLREREVAERFGVSHAPVREAFRHVARVGFIQIVPWRGAHVIDIDLHTATEVFELWKALFGVVCRLAAPTLTENQKAELARRVERIKAVVRETPDTFAHLRTSNSAGAYIAKCSGAPMAIELLDRVALFARWQHHVVMTDYLESFERRPGFRHAELWELLYFALIRNDPDGADAAARMLIAFSQDHFGAALEFYLAKRSVA